MERPTQERVQEVIAHLRDIAPKIPQVTAFGGNNRDKIDRQIMVLEKGVNYAGDMSDDEIEDDYELHGCLERAYCWLTGDDMVDGAEAFPTEWDDMVGLPPIKPLDPREFA